MAVNLSTWASQVAGSSDSSDLNDINLTGANMGSITLDQFVDTLGASNFQGSTWIDGTSILADYDAGL